MKPKLLTWPRSRALAVTLAAATGLSTLGGTAAFASDATPQPQNTSPAGVSAQLGSGPGFLSFKADVRTGAGLLGLSPTRGAGLGLSLQLGQPAALGDSRFLAKFLPGADQAKAEREAAQGTGVKITELSRSATGAAVLGTDKPLEADKAARLVQNLKNTGAVAYAEVDVRNRVLLTPNDPGYAPYQWDYTSDADGMRTPGAWNRSTGTGVTVAVIDTGITSHPDLNANMLPGYNFISDPTMARNSYGRGPDNSDNGDWYAAGECGSSSAANSSWHGTHVAGIVAAVTGNGIGVAGVAPDAKVVPVRALGKCGGYLSDIADAIVWASGGTVSGVPANPHPAQVINLSVGAAGACSATYQAAINSAVSRGVTVVVAAGNSAVDAANTQPANCQNVITVAASSPAGGLSYYSNYGSMVTITAPGGDSRYSNGMILSTLNDGTTTPGNPTYTWYQGTSMASPHIAGLVALMKSVDHVLTPAQAKSLLVQGARPMPAGCTQGCGAGLADATATLNLTPVG